MWQKALAFCEGDCYSKANPSAGTVVWLYEISVSAFFFWEGGDHRGDADDL